MSNAAIARLPRLCRCETEFDSDAIFRAGIGDPPKHRARERDELTNHRFGVDLHIADIARYMVLDDDIKRVGAVPGAGAEQPIENIPHLNDGPALLAPGARLR
ncbi:MAG: hypothetical protein WA417_16420 [Stellaceae bacterium]